MSLLFFHEKRAEIINNLTQALTQFEANKESFDTMYDIATDIKAEYPYIYVYQYDECLSISIPKNMSKTKFDVWLTYLEETYLDEKYELIKNHINNSAGEIIAEYKHKKTGKKVMLRFNNAHCQYVKTGKLIEEYATKCAWE